MGMPLVSIIMPTYNRAAYIGQTIASIQAQTYTNWELLVEDDGAADGTGEIIKQLGDSRIMYTPHPRTGITGKLKNAALARARGDMIAFMDSDDLWAPDKLKRQVELLEANPGAGFSITNWRDFSDMQNPSPPFHKEATGTTTANIFTAYCRADALYHIQTLVFHKHCLEKTGGFNEGRVFTDYSFIGELAWHYTAIVVHEPLLYRRVHATNGINATWAEDFAEYQDTVREYLQKGRINMDVVRTRLYLSHIHLAERYLDDAQRSMAIKNCLIAYKLRPFSITSLKKLVKALFL